MSNRLNLNIILFNGAIDFKKRLLRILIPLKTSCHLREICNLELFEDGEE
jgi:hypothetical protein